MCVNCNVNKLYCNVKWIVSDNPVLLGIYCIFLLCTVIQLAFSYCNICIVTSEGIISVRVSIIIIILIIKMFLFRKVSDNAVLLLLLLILPARN